MNNQWCSLTIIKLTSQNEIFIVEQNSRNHESVLPRKFGAIWYSIWGLYHTTSYL